jgi:hypothetical protein
VDGQKAVRQKIVSELYYSLISICRLAILDNYEIGGHNDDDDASVRVEYRHEKCDEVDLMTRTMSKLSEMDWIVDRDLNRERFKIARFSANNSQNWRMKEEESSSIYWGLHSNHSLDVNVRHFRVWDEAESRLKQKRATFELRSLMCQIVEDQAILWIQIPMAIPEKGIE